MIGAFVGTFNPVSMGHLMIAQGIINDLDIDKIIFVPVSDLYEKESLNVQASDRIAMLKLAIGEREDILIDELEVEIAKKTGRQNKTFETLDLLKEKYHDDVALIVGGDNLVELYWWHKASEMLDKYPLILVSRDGLDISSTIQDDKWLSENVHKYYETTSGVCKISSNLIRKWASEGKCISYYVTKEVENYIKEHHLYD